MSNQQQQQQLYQGSNPLLTNSTNYQQQQLLAPPTAQSPQQQQQQQQIIQQQQQQSIQQQLQQQAPTSFSLIACVHCRKAHRKCDRKLPVCSECACRGFGDQCTYAAPKKRGPKQQSSVSHKSKKRSNESSSDNEIISHQSPLKTKQRRFTVPGGAITAQNYFNQFPVTTSPSHDIQMEEQPNIFDNSSFKSVSQTVPVRYHPYETSSPSNMVHSFNDSGIFNMPANQAEPVPFDVQQVERTSQLNFRIHSGALLDFFLNFQGYSFPLFDRAYMDNLVLTCITTKNELLCKTVEEEQMMALLFSIHALCLQRIGKKQVAFHVYQRAREIIAKYFDMVSISFPIATASIIVSLYLFGQGDTGRAKVMFHIARVFIEEKRAHHENQIETLSQFSVQSQFLLNDTNLMDQILCLGPAVYKTFIGANVDISSLHLGAPIDTQIEAALNLVDKIGNDVLSCLNSKLQEKLDDSKHLSSMRLTYEIVFLGLKLKILSQSANNAIAIQNSRIIADQISSLCTNPLLVNCSILVVEAIIYASSLHLHDKSSPVNLLKMDLNTLNSLTQSFDLIPAKYAYLISGLEERYRKENVQTFSSNSQFPATFSGFDQGIAFHSMVPVQHPGTTPSVNNGRGSNFMDLLQSQAMPINGQQQQQQQQHWRSDSHHPHQLAHEQQVSNVKLAPMASATPVHQDTRQIFKTDRSETEKLEMSENDPRTLDPSNHSSLYFEEPAIF